MTKIRNCPGSGDSKIGGYAGPVDGHGRNSGTRKSPDAFSGASPPAGSACFSVNTCPQKRKGRSAVSFILAVFLCFSLFFTYEIEIGSVFNNFQTIGNVTERPVQAPAAEPVKAKEPWFGTLGDGKFQWRDIVSAMALPFAVFTSCKTEDAANQAPTADAGSNQNVTLASNLTVTLNGTQSTDPDDGIASYAWTCLSYTKHADVLTPYTKEQVTALITATDTDGKVTLALRKAGTYTFQLTVTDKSDVSATSNVTVTVNPLEDTRDIGVTFAPLGINPTVINLTPIYTPVNGWGSFGASDIRFEISDNKDNDNSKFTDGKIDASKALELYNGTWPWPPPLFIQVFYDNDDNKLGEYSFFAGDRWGDAGYFDRIHEDTNNNMVFGSEDQAISALPPPNASPLVLQLSKTTAELP